MRAFSVRPSKDIRTNYADISKLCKEHPVAVTVNGREDTVIMGHEQYLELEQQLAEMKAMLNFYAHLAQAEDDVKLGRTTTDNQVYEGLKAELELMRV